MTTEIYSCRDGQSLQQGKLELAQIDSKDEARQDAERRGGAGPTLLHRLKRLLSLSR